MKDSSVKHTPFISILIPCYNMERYVGECLDSIINQSFGDWEVVCTDDGSKDSTGRILDDYAAGDSRIRVIHSENVGVSTARNKAFDKSTGEWFWFVDSDDVLLDGALERIHQFVSSGKWDAVLFARWVDFSGVGGGTVPVADTVPVAGNGLISGFESPDTGKSLLFLDRKLPELPFTRIFRREVFGGVRYPDGVNWLEDSIQFYEGLCVKARWAFVDMAVYGYRYRPESLCHGWKTGKFPLVMESIARIFKIAKERLHFSESEFARLFRSKCGSAEYYMELALNHENRQGLQDVVAACDRFKRQFGIMPLRRSSRLKLLAVRKRCYWALPVLDFAQRVYAGLVAMAPRPKPQMTGGGGHVMKERNANLDVLRCLTMFTIVLSHVYNHGIFYRQSFALDLAFDYFLKWHVDAFLALSGWFGVRFSVKKFFRLYGLIVLCSATSFAVGRLIGLSDPFRITGGWYGNTYLCLMLVVPLLNEGIEGLVRKGVRTAWLAWCGFAAIIFVNWMSGNPYIGLIAYDVGPFSLIQMVFMYFTVRLLRLTNVAKVYARLWHLLLAVAAFLICAAFMPVSRTNYIAPYTITMSIAVFLLFEKYVKVPSWLGKLCVWAAPSMFSVYLLHETTSFGKMLHRIPVEWMAQSGCGAAVCLLGGTVACFAACLAIDSARRLALRFAARLPVVRRLFAK